MFRLTIEADFDTAEAAAKAGADAEEAIGKNNGDLVDTEIEDLGD